MLVKSHLLLIFLISLTFGIEKVFASELSKVQILTENLQLGESHYYNIPNLQKGDTVFISIERVSGNLDPIIGITKDRSDFDSFEEFFTLDIPKSLDKGLDFAEVFPDYADDYFLAWDDNGGRLSDASLTFQVEQEGDYKLVVAGAYYQLLRLNKYYHTFGQYRLIIGINTKDVLTGEAKPTGHSIVEQFGKFHKRVDEKTFQLSEEREYIEFPLNTFSKGDTIYIYVETTSGDLKPAIKLRDYGNKLLAFDNLSGENDKAILNYTLKEEGENYSLIVRGHPADEKFTNGSFRILVGTNIPEVIDGKGVKKGRPILREPIEVNVRLLIDQITNIDQTKENFTVVGHVLYEWVDPKYAYNPDSCKCNVIDYTINQFDQYVNENNLGWPRFLILNQQGRRFIQEANYRVYPDGQITYFERFTVTLQAPDFDFRKFPFDPQKFFVRYLLLYPTDFYVYKVDNESVEIGDQLGEEEWDIYDYRTEVTTRIFDKSFSEFMLEIDARRHVNYYMFRIFVPLLLIMIVSWGTFFMSDYSNRISVSVAVLLIFVAFNFTIGSDLPRLGYMTFMDGVLFAAFLITAFTVLSNVYFKRLESKGNIELADTVDRFFTFVYPIVYILILGLLIWVFIY